MFSEIGEIKYILFEGELEGRLEILWGGVIISLEAMDHGSEFSLVDPLSRKLETH